MWHVWSIGKLCFLKLESTIFVWSNAKLCWLAVEWSSSAVLSRSYATSRSLPCSHIFRSGTGAVTGDPHVQLVRRHTYITRRTCFPQFLRSSNWWSGKSFLGVFECFLSTFRCLPLIDRRFLAVEWRRSLDRRLIIVGDNHSILVEWIWCCAFCWGRCWWRMFWRGEWNCLPRSLFALCCERNGNWETILRRSVS